MLSSTCKCKVHNTHVGINTLDGRGTMGETTFLLGPTPPQQFNVYWVLPSSRGSCSSLGTGMDRVPVTCWGVWVGAA